jgi:subtilase family serine protease
LIRAKSVFGGAVLGLLGLSAIACGSSDPAITNTCGTVNPQELLHPRIERPEKADAPVDARAIGPASATEVLDVIISLKQRVGGDALAREAASAVDPGSGERSNPHSIQEVAERFGATDATEAIVVSYFAREGLAVKVDVTRTYAVVPMTVSQATALTGAKFSQYRDERARCHGDAREDALCLFIAPTAGESVSLPGGLFPALPEDCDVGRYVHGLSSRVLYRRTASELSTASAVPITYPSDPDSPKFWEHSGTAEGCPKAKATGALMPNQLRDAYGYPHTNIKSGMSIAVLEFGESPSQSNMDAFASCFGIHPSPTIVSVPIGKPSAIDNSAEQAIDAQAIAAMAPGVETIHSVVGVSSGATFQQMLSKATSLQDPKGTPVSVISISLGTCERELASNWQTSIADLETVLAKAALTNQITVLASSGDSGSSPCNPSFVGSQIVFDVDVGYPQSSPFVVAVGGTRLMLVEKTNAISLEGVWNASELFRSGVPISNEASGGGLSGSGDKTFAGFKAPSWQTKAGLRYKTRALPDVVTFGDGYPGFPIYHLIDVDSNTFGFSAEGGTSLAAPIFAAAILRYNADNPSKMMGHAASVLYPAIHRGAIHVRDIEKGDNKLATVDPKTEDWVPLDVGCCTAKVGYDLASGWGSVDIASLLAYVIPEGK